MNKQSVLRIPTSLLFAVTFIVIVIGTFLIITQQVTANEPRNITGGDTPLSSHITYQGELNNAGSPINGTCSMKFQLYDEETNGSSVSNELTETVPVSDGIFTVSLDFGSDPFKGAARYLNIAVKCSGDSSYTTMGSRVALTAAPYALSLQPGATISGDDFGAMLNISNDYSDGLSAIVNHDSNQVYAVRGEILSAESYSAGVYGLSVNGAGAGVRGVTHSNSNNAAGVYGENSNPAGYGVYAKGNAHVDGDLTWKPTTSYLSIPAVAMQPNDESIEWDFSTSGEALYNPVSEYFVAPVFLPHNATVTEIKTWWIDGSANNATLSLRRVEPGVIWSDMVTVSSEGASGYISENSETTIANPVIDNSQYSYLLYLTLPDADFSYFQTVIEYTTTAPN